MSRAWKHKQRQMASNLYSHQSPISLLLMQRHEMNEKNKNRLVRANELHEQQSCSFHFVVDIDVPLGGADVLVTGKFLKYANTDALTGKLGQE